MKKRIISFLLSAALLCGGTIPAMAADEISVTLNGEKLTFDVAPVNIDGRVMVPMRGIFEAFGAEVEWDEASQRIYAQNNDVSVHLQIGIPVMRVEIMKSDIQQTIPMDVAPQIVNGRTMVPVRAVSEVFDAEVAWDMTTVKIDTKTNKWIDPTNVTVSKTLSLRDRLLISVPEGFVSDRPLDIAEPSVRPYQLTHVGGDIPLILIVREEFKISSGDIVKDEEQFKEHTMMHNEMTRIAENISNDEMQAVKITPTSYPTSRYYGTCIKGALIKTKDDLLIAVEINIDEAYFEEKDQWMPLADAIIDSIRLGTKTIDRSARTIQFEGYEADLPKDYLFVREAENTIATYFFRKMNYFSDDLSTSMDINFTEEPFIFHEMIDVSDITKTSDEIDGQSIQWSSYESGFSIAETIFPMRGDDRLKVQVLAMGGTPEDLEVLKSIVKTLTSSE